METPRDTTPRPPGLSSHLRRAPGARRSWKAANGQTVNLPVVLDLVQVEEGSGERVWSVEARVDLLAGQPRLTGVRITGKHGLDPVRLQRFFRWATPLDVVQRTVPALLAKGLDPFEHEYAIDGYPDAADIGRKPTNRLSDEFLEEVARQYLAIGRGYAGQIARQRGVSERTIVNWVEKARKRGILSRVRPGQHGGHIVPRGS